VSTDNCTRHRRRATRRLVASVIAITSLLTLFAVSAVQASAQQSDAPTETHSWALAPSGADPTQPGSRPNLSYSLAPGTTIDDSVTLWNYSDVQLTFHVYATDAYNNRSGNFDLLTEGSAPTDLGSWVKVPQEYVTVPATTSMVLPITITVPPDARPGDHTAGIVAASRTPGIDDQGHEVVLDRRTGSRIYLRVDGEVSSDLAIEHVQSDYQAAVNPLDGALDVTFTVRNVGNVRLGARPVVEVSDLFGLVETRRVAAIPELLPGNEVTLHEHFTGVAATVRVTTEVRVTPFTPRGSDLDSGSIQQARATATAHAWAIPWSMLIVLALIALGVYVARRARQRHRTTPSAVGGVRTGPAAG